MKACRIRLLTLAAISTQVSMSLTMNFNEVWQLRLVAEEKHLDNSNSNEYEWGWEENQIMGKDPATYDNNAKDA
jgi:hypothetical protein